MRSPTGGERGWRTTSPGRPKQTDGGAPMICPRVGRLLASVRGMDSRERLTQTRGAPVATRPYGASYALLPNRRAGRHHGQRRAIVAIHDGRFALRAHVRWRLTLIEQDTETYTHGEPATVLGDLGEV